MMRASSLQFLIAVLGLCACTVEAGDHPRYGLTCAAPDASYRGFCLNVGDGGAGREGEASIDSGVRGEAGSRAMPMDDTPMMSGPRAGSEATAGSEANAGAGGGSAGGEASAGSEASAGAGVGSAGSEASAGAGGGSAGSAGTESTTPSCVPKAESCANPAADDDCDGEPDDVPGLGEACTASAMGRCAAGQSRCQGDRLQCAAGAPREEQCDGSDDDCDGKVDETFDLPNNEQNCGRCGRTCNAGQTCCDGTCVNVNDSADHCGACGNACGAGLSCCTGTCFNLGSDQNNCGSCGNACGLLEGCCRTACRLLSLGC